MGGNRVGRPTCRRPNSKNGKREQSRYEKTILQQHIRLLLAASVDSNQGHRANVVCVWVSCQTSRVPSPQGVLLFRTRLGTALREARFRQFSPSQLTKSRVLK